MPECKLLSCICARFERVFWIVRHFEGTDVTFPTRRSINLLFPVFSHQPAHEKWGILGTMHTWAGT